MLIRGTGTLKYLSDMKCDLLSILRQQRNDAIAAVAGLAKRRVFAGESQAIYARLTLAYKVEMQHKSECPKCAGVLPPEAA